MSGPNAPLYAKRSLRVINAESDVSDDGAEEEFCDAPKCARYNITCMRLHRYLISQISNI